MSSTRETNRRRPRVLRLARAWLWVVRRRAERRSPFWLRKSAPWLSSLAFHLIVLFVMAVLLLQGRRTDQPAVFDANFDGQLREDLTALAPADRSGEPFTRLDSLDEPSISFERDAHVSRLVEMRPTPLEPETRLESRVNRSMAEVGPAALPERLVSFSGRSAEQRARLVRREGGTKESEAAVTSGLDWIARHQSPDGRWRLDTSSVCRKPACRKTPAMDSDTAATGLALLPLLGAGHTHVEPGPYQENIRRGIEWLIHAQKANGDLWVGGGGNTHLYSHAIATMALSEAFGMTRDVRLREPSQRAVNFIVQSQHGMGGWRYNPGQAGDTSVFGWQMLALRSAFLAGLKVPPNSIRGGVRYLDLVRADPRGTTYSYQPGGPATPVMTAEALLIRQYLGWTRGRRSMVLGSQAVARDLLNPKKSKQRNLYYWYYATQMLHHMRNDTWKLWNAHIRDRLVSEQVRGRGCDRGSWDPQRPQPDRWGARAGRLFTTSLSILTLEVYYRYLPLYSDTAGSMAASD